MIGSSGHSTVTLKQHSPGIIDFLELQSNNEEKAEILLRAERSIMISHILQLNWMKNKALHLHLGWLDLEAREEASGDSDLTWMLANNDRL